MLADQGSIGEWRQAVEYILCLTCCEMIYPQDIFCQALTNKPR